MSGHSKWSQIKRQKGAADVKKGALYTKLGHAIALAVRESGKDPSMNFKLRLALDKAKESNMPNSTIERAIARGAGEGPGQQVMEEVLYEGFAPGGSALLISAVTDNKNRTNGDIRNVLTKSGGSLGSSGSVQWRFDNVGIVELTVPAISDEQELALIDAGAEDIQQDEGKVIVQTKPDHLELVKRTADQQKLPVDNAEIAWIPKNEVTTTPEQREHIQKIIDLLEAIDDVTSVTTNATLA